MRFTYLILCCLVLWLLVSADLAAQVPPIRFRRIGPAQGLTQSTVRKIYQDRQGFLWIATRDGLNCYDGHVFRTFRHRHGDPTSLQSGDVMALGEDLGGRLWVGTDNGGLQQLNPDGRTFTHIVRTTDGLDVSQWGISSIVTDRKGRVWAGTLGSGWLIVDAKRQRISQYLLPDSLRNARHVTCGLKDRDGSLWFGLDNGLLVHFDPDGRFFRSYRLPSAVQQSRMPKRITSCLRSQSGQLLIATRNMGLYVLDERQGQLNRIYGQVGSDQSDNLITAITEDTHHLVWLGTDDGIRRFSLNNPDQVECLRANPTDESTLSTHAVQSLLTDQQGNVWVGTWEGGINVWYNNPPRIEVISHRPTGPRRLLSPKVSAVGTDQKGNLWVGSVRGLLRFSADGRSTQPISAPFASQDVYRMFTDRSGHLYVSYWNGGVVQYDAQGHSKVLTLTHAASRHVLSFANKQAGGVWMIASDQRLYTYDPKSHQIKTLGPILALLRTGKFTTFTCLLEDRRGWLWFGTYDQGLIGWNRHTGQVKEFTSGTGGISNNHITCLFEDSAGNLWVGTNSAGLNCKQPNQDSFRLYTKRNGLSGDMIAAIEEDGYGNLWISTTEGLTRLNRSTRQMTVYGEADGLPTSEFVNPGSVRLPNGDIAFASTQGLVLLHPDQLTKPLPFPQAYLAGLELFNRPVAAGQTDSPLTVALNNTKELTLNPRQNVFTLTFGALSWGQNRHLAYAYKLDGFDSDWRYTDQQKNTTYTNLSPGTYTFRLKAAQTDQKWGPEKQLLITVQPPWFKTRWAVAGYIMLLLGLIVLIRRNIRIQEKLKADARIQEMRAQSIRQLDDAKTSFFTNVSHEFKTPLTLILTPLEKLLTDELPTGERLLHQFRVMHRNASRLLTLINQLLDLSKLENGVLQPQIRLNNLIQHLHALVRSFDTITQGKDIDLNTWFEPALASVWSDLDFVEKIVTNLISNSLKHTPEGGQISLRGELIDNQLQLTVIDTGTGMTPQEQTRIFERFYQGEQRKSSGTGIGLSLIRELIDRLGGTIQVTSAPGSGSTFIVRLPAKAEAFNPDWLDKAETVSTVLFEESAPDQPSTLPAGALVLLIAEDDLDLNAYLTDYFASEFQVLSATDGQQALQLARDHLPDAIISDWIMPALEGPELCRLLKTDEKTSHIPIVLLTSKASLPSQLTGLQEGVDDYVTKPFSATLLRSRVQNLIMNRHRLRQAFGKEVWLRPSDVKLSNVDELFLQRATACIEEHIDDANFDIEQLQESLNMSQMQLYRKLKSLTNLSGRDFIRYIRLQRAAQLLETGQVTVSEAGYRVGFNDRSYFSRAFKKQFGHAPTEHLLAKEKT
ncbi:two-component regulator propeller domain-containing protein [Spirosoma sp. SC4-14]|uniref:hybrid sensor histidine kinase/response regulator transcription factor n=1 Tax=Spirosoma sp. SC4-14 TaxID=3128900 RepID=UPI0030D5018A